MRLLSKNSISGQTHSKACMSWHGMLFILSAVLWMRSRKDGAIEVHMWEAALGLHISSKVLDLIMDSQQTWNVFFTFLLTKRHRTSLSYFLKKWKLEGAMCVMKGTVARNVFGPF